MILLLPPARLTTPRKIYADGWPARATSTAVPRQRSLEASGMFHFYGLSDENLFCATSDDALGTSICQFRRSMLSRTPELMICHQAAHHQMP